MNKSYKELIDKLNERNIPPYPSLLPLELRTPDLEESYTATLIHLLKEIETNKELTFLLPEFTNLPLQINLEEVENLLKEEISFNFEEAEEIVERSSDFLTASSKKITTEKKQKISEKSEESDTMDSHILEKIKAEIIDTKQDIKWNDVVGLDLVKKNINEIVLWPMQRPDLFKGLRGPPKGLLLFGPPGTGKTMIASSLTSKWVGEGEKMVRGLFYLARKMQPSVIFVDEIDSLLCQRQENENEGSRRIKTEFLVQFDGVGTSSEDKILLIGATNRPQEIDEAARRRLVKRIYVPLPENEARILMIKNLLKDINNEISLKELEIISEKTKGYSGSDIFNLCREASLEPLREVNDILNIEFNKTRPVEFNDFIKATKQIRMSVSNKDLKGYLDWNEIYGCT